MTQKLHAFVSPLSNLYLPPRKIISKLLTACYLYLSLLLESEELQKNTQACLMSPGTNITAKTDVEVGAWRGEISILRREKE